MANLKKTISWLLIIAVNLQLVSCCSSYHLQNFSDLSFEKNTVSVKLKDGSDFKSPEFQHASNLERSSFIIGTGIIRDPSGNFRDFGGVILPSGIDSQKTDALKLFVWQSDGSLVELQKTSSIQITPDMQKGFWFNNNGSIKLIIPDDVSSIEILEKNETFILIFGIVTVTALTAMVVGAIFAALYSFK